MLAGVETREEGAGVEVREEGSRVEYGDAGRDGIGVCECAGVAGVDGREFVGVNRVEHFGHLKDC